MRASPTLARLAHPFDEPAPQPPRARFDAWLARRHRFVARAAASAVIVSMLAGVVIEPVATVRSGDVVVRYEPDFLTRYEAAELAAAHVTAQERIARVTGLRANGTIVVTARSGAGRDLGGADGIVLHYQKLDTDRVAGYRRPPHELVHVLAARLNPEPSPLLREGVAVYVSWLLDGGFALSSTASDLAVLERSDAFGTGDLHRDVTREYAAAGTVVRYLVERFGWERFWRMYAAGSTLDSASRAEFGFGAEPLRHDITCWLRAQGVAPQRAGWRAADGGTCPTA